MIEYRLRDADNNIYNLNTSAVTVQLKEATTQLGDEFQFENSIVPKSYLPGSVLVGNNRLMERVFTLTMERTDSDSASYRSDLNALLSFIEKTVYIEDITNSIRIKVVIDLARIEYGEGGLKHMSMDTFTFVALNPYWEDLTETELTGSIVADTIKEIAINNLGFLPSPPIIELTTTAAIDSVQCFLSSNNYGVQVDDALFGTSGNLVMTIDCEAGTVVVGTTYDYNRNIVDGTSFFSFIVGTDTLNILCADEAATYSVTYRNRYYL